MNKAFVREPEGGDTLCPRCGAAGVETPWTAVEAFAGPTARARLAATVFFCETPRCEAAYFDGLEAVISANELPRPIPPKDPSAPLCGCFGLTLADVEADIAEGAPSRIRALLAKSKTPAAHCADASPSGRCCLPEVQRWYFRLKGGGARS